MKQIPGEDIIQAIKDGIRSGFVNKLIDRFYKGWK
jgi:hypothetical protein